MNTRETIFNLYYYYSHDLIVKELGCVTHEVSGTDDEKLQFLKENFEDDLHKAVRFPVPEMFIIESQGIVTKGAIDLYNLNLLAQRGQDSIVFEEIFKHYNAASSPMILQTPVKDEKIHIDRYEDIKQPVSKDFPGTFYNLKIVR